MHRRSFLALTAQLATAATACSRADEAVTAIRLPPLPTDPSRWLNSQPLTAVDLAGRPVLVEFWTYGCSNCRNTLPWMKRIAERHAPRGLAIIAVHTPEFDAERDPAAVRTAIERLAIRYPVLLDPRSNYWNALSNRYWPAFYLFDRQHWLVDTRIGELHAGERRADEFEARIAALLPAA